MFSSRREFVSLERSTRSHAFHWLSPPLPLACPLAHSLFPRFAPRLHPVPLTGDNRSLFMARWYSLGLGATFTPDISIGPISPFCAFTKLADQLSRSPGCWLTHSAGSGQTLAEPSVGPARRARRRHASCAGHPRGRSVAIWRTSGRCRL